MAHKYGQSKSFQTGREERQDWKCDSCTFSNRHFRGRCYRCHKSRPDAGYFNPEGQTYNDKRAKQEEKTGVDWICPNPNCKYSNRHFRTICFKCRNPRSNTNSSSCWPSKEVEGEDNDGPSNNISSDNPMAKFGLPTFFGPVRNRSEPSRDVLSGQSEPDATKIKIDDPMGKYGLPSGFGFSNKPFGGNNIHQNDNWICSNCQISNHGGDRSCSNCNYPKSNILPKRSVEASKTIDHGKQGDWTCHSCSKSTIGYPNRSFRNTCYRCDAPKPLNNSTRPDILPVKQEWMETYEADVNYFQDQYKEGDWYCAPCGNLANTQNRSTCYKCKRHWSQSQSYQSGDNKHWKNDWKCSQCNNMKSYWKKYCPECGQNRGHVERSEVANNIETKGPDKDWWCTKCKSSNIYHRDACFRCRASRPSITSKDKLLDQNVRAENLPSSVVPFDSSIPPPPILAGRKIWLENSLEGESAPTNETYRSPSKRANSKSRSREPLYKKNNRIVNKTTTINPQLFLDTNSMPNKSSGNIVSDSPSRIPRTSQNVLTSKNIKERSKADRCDTRTPNQNEESRIQQTSTPANSNCSLFSVTTTVCSPLLRPSVCLPPGVDRFVMSPVPTKTTSTPLQQNSDKDTKTYADDEPKSDREFQHSQYRNKRSPNSSESYDCTGAALQVPQSRYNDKRRYFQKRQSHLKGSTSWKANPRITESNYREAHIPHSQYYNDNDKTDKQASCKTQKEHRKNDIININAHRAKDPIDSSVDECNKETDLRQFYKERKRKAEEEKEKDIESQRNVRDKLAALAGGYLTGAGTSTGSYTRPPAKRNDQDTVVEVVVLDGDDDDIVAVDADASISNSEQGQEGCQKDQTTHTSDKVTEESNELKRVLRSNLPDDEKATVLAKFGIRIKKPECGLVRKKTCRNENLWLVAKVAEADTVFDSDKNSNEKEDNEIIIID